MTEQDKEKIYHAIVYAIILIGAVLVYMGLPSCEKSEPVEIPQKEYLYTVKYWVNSDSAAIRYRIHDDYFKHYVFGHWDTTFYADSGRLMLIVTSWSNPMNCGYWVNRCTIDMAFDVDYFESEYKLP